MNRIDINPATQRPYADPAKDLTREEVEAVRLRTFGAIPRVGPVPTPALNAELDQGRRGSDTPMSARYPKYYRAIPNGMKELDTYAINMMFPINDPTGALIHARKKLLVPGVRTGGKTLIDDVREARDTLTRWLQLQGQ